MQTDRTKDGQTPKRRGPKPDSKPALTRRQELNRQAQRLVPTFCRTLASADSDRTHRERKEMYIKALEQEVLRLKEVFADSTRERDKIAAENQRLKQVLAQHGISYDFGESPVKFQRENSNYGTNSSGSISGSYRGASESTGFSPPPTHGLPIQLTPQQMQQVGNMQQPHLRHNMAQLPTNRLDYDQIGIDFVLTYDSQGRLVQGRPPYPSPPPQQA